MILFTQYHFYFLQKQIIGLAIEKNYKNDETVAHVNLKWDPTPYSRFIGCNSN